MMAATNLVRCVVFGATGPTGIELLRQSLEAGHKVLALIRDPSKIPADIKDNCNLSVETVDVFSSESIAPHLQEGDAVLCALGYKGKGIGLFGKNPNFYVPAAKSIVAAMKQKNIRRLIVVASMGTKKGTVDSKIFEYVVRNLFLCNVLDDMGFMEDYLSTEQGHIDYTVMRPPGLGNGPKTDKPFIVGEDVQFVPFDQTQNRGGMPTLDRADLARYILDTLHDNKHIHKCVCVCVAKPMILLE